jgi:hypothetical protein
MKEVLRETERAEELLAAIQMRVRD